MGAGGALAEALTGHNGSVGLCPLLRAPSAWSAVLPPLLMLGLTARLPASPMAAGLRRRRERRQVGLKPVRRDQGRWPGAAFVGEVPAVLQGLRPAERDALRARPARCGHLAGYRVTVGVKRRHVVRVNTGRGGEPLDPLREVRRDGRPSRA